MDKKMDIPLYDEVVKSPEFTDLDHKDIDTFEHARKNDFGLEPEDTQERMTLGSENFAEKKVSLASETIIDDDIPLYDEVVKSLEFSELNNDNEADKVPRRMELGAEPERTQEKVLFDGKK